MIRDYLNDIYTTIELAKQRDAVPSLIMKNGKECTGFFSLKEVGGKNPVYDKLEDALIKHLQSLDYDVLETLQVVMWLGRGDYVNDEITGEELYIKAKEEFKDVIDKDSIGIITYITQKKDLGNYLEKGITLLKL